LVSMLRHYLNFRCKDWDDYLPPLIYAYNTTPTQATGDTPFHLMFGRDPRPLMRLPEEVVQQAKNDDLLTYRLRLNQRLLLAYTAAQQSLTHVLRSYKERWSKNCHFRELKAGDAVWVQRFAYGAPLHRKLSSKFVGPYRIRRIEEPNVVLVHLNKDEGEWTVHADQVKLCEYRDPIKWPEYNADYRKTVQPALAVPEVEIPLSQETLQDPGEAAEGAENEEEANYQSPLSFVTDPPPASPARLSNQFSGAMNLLGGSGEGTSKLDSQTAQTANFSSSHDVLTSDDENENEFVGVHNSTANLEASDLGDERYWDSIEQRCFDRISTELTALSANPDLNDEQALNNIRNAHTRTRATLTRVPYNLRPRVQCTRRAAKD
jgi:hypothetical protein